MNIKECFREEGRQEGMRQGMQRMQQVVLNMLQKKTDIAFISEAPGLPEAEIVKLQTAE